MKAKQRPNTAVPTAWARTASSSRQRRRTSEESPGCGPDAVATVPVTSRTRHPAAAATAARRRLPRHRRTHGAALGSERCHDHDDSGAEDHGRQKEVGHDQVRVEVEANGEGTERRLRGSPEKDAEGSPADPARKRRNAERGERGDERRHDHDPADEPVAELDEGVEVLLGKRLPRLATGPRLAAES